MMGQSLRFETEARLQRKKRFHTVCLNLHHTCNQSRHRGWRWFHYRRRAHARWWAAFDNRLSKKKGKTMETLTKAPAVVPAEDEARCEIEAVVGRARVAQAAIENYAQEQAAIENYAQEQADALVTAVGWQVYKSREALAKLAVKEGGFGNVQDKIAKFANRVMGTLADMASIKTCGIVEEDPARGLVKIAKPVGVIAALIPTTGPDATPPVKALGALKA